jgi:FAD/FMN-containing dehydrogenase
LREHGLALPIVPTSAPGASLGGWVAAGGAGIGSNTRGYVSENVVAVDAVSPTGAPLNELGHVVGLEGTTGFITSITFRVVPAEAVSPFLIGFKTMDDLIAALVSPWSMPGYLSGTPGSAAGAFYASTSRQPAWRQPPGRDLPCYWLRSDRRPTP